MTKDLLDQIEKCMLADRHRFRKQFQRLQLKPNEQQLQKFKQAIEQSVAKLEARTLYAPVIQYGDLPILNYKDEIIKQLHQNSVVIVAGETGSGKSTQLPKICLEAGLGRSGLIGHTQPRRIAAKSIAHRVAHEMNSILGHLVGYEVRFDKKIDDDAYIKVMTDGILLQETIQNKWLTQYDCIIIDEAHERSLNIDFLLAFLKKLLKKRTDLKIIITSATIEVEAFANYFNAPIIQVEGRTYPVEVIYLDEKMSEDVDPALKVLQTVESAISRGPGDILIFQSGEKEIHEVASVLSKQKHLNLEILPLYAKLNAKAQSKIFQNAKKRKVIIATNIAETSLTVPNIRYVIDSGLARMSRYNYRTKMQRLNIEAISQASCKQRLGRCGRVGPGICYRLYTKEDYEVRDPYTTPEILRTDLSSVLLKMLSLNIRDIESFGFISPPDSRYIKDGLSLLERLGAIKDRSLTQIGFSLARLPIAPRLGRILIAANQYHALTEGLIIVSFLSIEDVRERPHEEVQKASEAHAQFLHPESDFMTILNLWKFIFKHKQQLSHNQFRKACQQNYLSYLRVCEWFDVHEQLQDYVKDERFKINQVDADYASIHKALITGLVDTIGIKEDKKEYMGPRNIKFTLHPSSALYAKPPTWLVSFAIVLTTKNYARMNAKIESQWIIEAASPLLKRQYSDAHFDIKTQSVVAIEKLLLFGLLVGQHKSNYEKISPREARKIFIQEALCGQLLTTNMPFYQKNKATIAQVLALEERIRRTQILFDENRVCEFYEKVLPPDIASKRALELWIKSNDDRQFIFSASQIELTEPDVSLLEDFPEEITAKGLKLKVTYKFDLSADDDGALIAIPFAKLPYFIDYDFTLAIKGFRAERISYYFKSLPKSVRNSFSPVGVHIQNVNKLVEDATQSLDEIMIQYCADTLGVKLNKEHFKHITFPPHLKPHFKVIDENEKVIAISDDLTAVYKSMESSIPQVPLMHGFQEKKEMTKWDFGDVPEAVAIANHQELFLYPALVDADPFVELRLFNSKPLAAFYHEQGLTRFYLLYLNASLKSASKSIKGYKKEIAKYYPFGDSEQLLEAIAYQVCDAVFVYQHEGIRTQKIFLERCQSLTGQFNQTLNAAIQLIVKVLIERANILQQLEKKQKFNPIAAKDIAQQLSRLFDKDFIRTTPYIYLKRYPIYLRAIEERIEKMSRMPEKDKQALADILEIEKIYLGKLSLKDKMLTRRDPMNLFRWKIEEFRVSLFAQNLGTLESVSKVRLLKILNEIS